MTKYADLQLFLKMRFLNQSESMCALPIKKSGGIGTNGYSTLRKVVARAEMVPRF